ncbi:MAG TPA: ThuA domain-containing protein [Pseudonocardiaceae bacterium]|nr:ThuA domain-containing protein [Pseudonocardiaceae bacterium]
MTSRTALVVRGGWEGHFPIEATDRYADELRAREYQVTVSDTLDSYLDAELLSRTDLIVHCWTMGTITPDQLAGLSAAVLAGTGLAGWHGGIIDSFRAEPGYHLITGGQFVHHPKGFVDYKVRAASPVPHPLVAGLGEFAVHTELYTVHVDPSIHVHAVTVGDGTSMPVTWTRNWGEGKVFATTLGHHPPDFEVPETNEMIVRGLLWATR